MNVSLPFECHNVTYQWKGLDQNNIVCEYEVNMSTNETEKRNFNTTMLKIKVMWRSKSQCDMLVITLWELCNIVCEYEVNTLTNYTVITNPKLWRKMINLFKNNVRCQGHLKVNVAMLFVKGSLPKLHCVWVWSKSVD